MQNSAVAYVRVMGVCPNLVMLVTISWTLLSGIRRGMMVALAGGFVLDAISGGPFGAATFSLLAVALATGIAEANLLRWAWLLPYVAAPAGTVLYNLVYVTFLQMGGLSISWASALGHVVLPLVLANTLRVVIVHALMRLGKAGLSSRRAEVGA